MFDGVAGVEAQSVTVWRQADRYSIPRVAFVNKMDRIGASMDRTMDTMVTKLSAVPLPLQLPVGEASDFSSVRVCANLSARVHADDLHNLLKTKHLSRWSWR